jgi:hypothetical protein
LATILAGQGDAGRHAVTAVPDGAAARQLSERADDVLGLPI